MCCDEIPYNKLGRALAKSRAKGIISPTASASRGQLQDVDLADRKSHQPSGDLTMTMTIPLMVNLENGQFYPIFGV